MARRKTYSVYLHFNTDSWEGVKAVKAHVEDLTRSAGLHNAAYIYMQEVKTGDSYRKYGRKKWIKDKT